MTSTGQRRPTGVKQRLERLEEIIRVDRVPMARQLLRLALAHVSDEDLAVLKLIFYRGAPFMAHNEEERATLERLDEELQAVRQRITAGTPLETVFA